MDSGYTLMISLMDGIIKVIGIPSHTEYEFTNENRVQSIKNEDVMDLLSKRRTFAPCCNADNTDPRIFALYE